MELRKLQVAIRTSRALYYLTSAQLTCFNVGTGQFTSWTEVDTDEFTLGS